MALESSIIAGLAHTNEESLRRLARYLRVRMVDDLDVDELITEIKWKIDPWRDPGMY